MYLTCEISGNTFEVSEQDLEFYSRVSPTIGGVKLSLPPPRLCPDERQRRRLAFRNERYLYKRKCSITNESIVSAYSPDLDLKICSKKSWLEQDNTEFGRDFDFNKTFFEQFSALYMNTYKCAVSQNGEMQNSEYTHFCGWLRDCYLLFDSGKSEDCFYGVFNAYCKNCIDTFHSYHSELCYDCINIENCYATFFSFYSSGCSNSAYLDSCISCSNCLCCANLHNKQYYVFNKYVGKEKFTEIWNQTFNGSFAEQKQIQKQFKEFLLKVSRKNLRNINCEDSTGDNLTRCSNVKDSYNCVECKDCRYCYDLFVKTNDCYDIATFGEGMQYCYELSACGGALGKSEVSNCFFSIYLYYGGYNILYSVNCHENSQNLFGCADLRKKQYCILNKQYSEKEYNVLVPKIVEHMRNTKEWGEFFPIKLSPFGYNQSLAQEFYPLSKNEVSNYGARWSDYENPIADIKQTINAQKLTDVNQIEDQELLKFAIKCESSGKLFKLIEKELKFYKRYGLALPRFHPEERHRLRALALNPRKLWPRKCTVTGKEILSSYPKDSPYSVISEQAYLDAIE